MHNGVIDEFERDQRSLTLAIDPDFFLSQGINRPGSHRLPAFDPQPDGGPIERLHM